MPPGRRRLAPLVALVFITADAAAGQSLEFKMISSGPNRPGVAVWAPPMRELLAGLHAGIAPDQLAPVLGLSRGAVRAAVDSLRAEGLVVGADGSIRPSCMVVSADEGAALAALAATHARGAVPLLRRAVGDLRPRYREIRGFANFEFDDVSFFLASDVLLDNWQIGAIERRWLRAERPLRGRSRYYCAIFARTADDREAFGIYGNLMAGLPDGRMLGVYGNRRGGGNDLSSLPRARLARLASLPDTGSRAVLLARVLDRLQQAAGGAAAADLEAMGLVRRGRPVLAVLDTADDRRLSELASSLTDSLVSFLDGLTPQLRAAWESSPWRAGTTFEEFRIWWYHFFYTALTDQLASEGAIRIPETGLFHYVLAR